MATAMQITSPVGQIAISPDEDQAGEAPAVRRGGFECECGHLLRVFGGGRHRIYFEPGDTGLDDPVMNRACPQCGRGLPGKNRPWVFRRDRAAGSPGDRG